MQNQSIFSSLCDSQTNYHVIAIDKPEIFFNFELCFIGKDYLLGREKNIWTMLDSKVFMVRAQSLPVSTTKLRHEIFLGLDFPRKIRVNCLGQVLEGWFIAINADWIGIETATGRIWLNLQGLREISIGTVDN